MLFEPQAYTLPLDLTDIEKSLPAPRRYTSPNCSCAKVSPFLTSTGIGDDVVVILPTPSCPLLFEPQAYTSSSFVSASICSLPTATLRTSSKSTFTGEFTKLSSFDAPSCPLLFEPHVYTTFASSFETAPLSSLVVLFSCIIAAALLPPIATSTAL